MQILTILMVRTLYLHRQIVLCCMYSILHAQIALNCHTNRSWNTPRAVAYRDINHLNNKGLLGTAVNVQAMVFGNKGDTSGTGVCFTRNPSDGTRKFYGEFLMNELSGRWNIKKLKNYNISY